MQEARKVLIAFFLAYKWQQGGWIELKKLCSINHVNVRLEYSSRRSGCSEIYEKMGKFVWGSNNFLYLGIPICSPKKPSCTSVSCSKWFSKNGRLLKLPLTWWPDCKKNVYIFSLFAIFIIAKNDSTLYCHCCFHFYGYIFDI